MQKRVLSNKEARVALLNGIDQLSNTIKATLGPKGRNVVIANEYIGPYITNDGATIAREFILEDAFENVGIELVKEVALKTNDLAGDGTTTATLLAQKIIHEGITYLEQGYSPILIKEAIHKAVEKAIFYLSQNSVAIDSPTKIKDIACISSGDQLIGEMIGNAFAKIGNELLISIEETREITTKLEIKNGFTIDEGYLSPYMLTNQIKMVTDFKNPYFIITDQQITDIHQLSPLLDQLIKIEANVVLISNAIDEAVLSTLVVNTVQNIINIVAIKAPSSHEKQKEILEDIAIITGGKVISTTLGLPLEKASLEDLGRAMQVQVFKDTTVIIDGLADFKVLEYKKSQIKNQLMNTSLEYEKNRLEDRLAKFSESAAVIKVGALSELELKEKKMKIEDAICATKVAIKEGILPGGGKAYLNTAKYLEAMLPTLDEEEKIGFKIIVNALQEPTLQLLDNAGLKDRETIFKKIFLSDENIGYNIRNNTFVDMIETGIIDPTAVEKVALQSAASIASLILTTHCVLVDVSQESTLKKEWNDQLLQANNNGLY